MNLKITILFLLTFSTTPFLIAQIGRDEPIGRNFKPDSPPPLRTVSKRHLPLKISDLLSPADTFNPRRFWSLMGSGTATYVGSMVLLNNVWYSAYPRAPFHFFNDWGEWHDVDKAGHALAAYVQAGWVYNAVRWTGMKSRNAAWLGMAAGTFIQTSFEVLDGYSAEWGFSWADIAYNTAGCALFGLQQAAWDEQRVFLKVSNTPKRYDAQSLIKSADGSKTTTLKTRTDELFGNNYTQTFFKDYNALIFWASVNPGSFMKNSRFPYWLNVAVGYGAENLYGGFRNEWPKNTQEFSLSAQAYPRYSQFYLSLDIDLSRVKTKSKLLRAFCRTFNFVKIPAPAIEFNTLGKVKFHPLIF
jgi:uncharacterized protein YfiM (DUF2279 family)